MKETRQIIYYEFCPKKYDFVKSRIFNRKKFLRFFDFRVRFNENVPVHYFDNKYLYSINVKL